MSDSTPDLIHSERDVLMRYLRKHRNAVVAASEGLTDVQQRRPGVPSGTNLLGLVQHLTVVEIHWFRMVFLGEDVEGNDSMTVAPEATRARHRRCVPRRVCPQGRDHRRVPDLSTLAQRPNPGENDLDSLRLIMAHMVEETRATSATPTSCASSSTATSTTEAPKREGSAARLLLGGPPPQRESRDFTHSCAHHPQIRCMCAWSTSMSRQPVVWNL